MGTLTGRATVCKVDDVVKQFLGCLLMPVCAGTLPIRSKNCNIVAGVCTVATLLVILLACNVRANFFQFTGGKISSPVHICSAALLSMKTATLLFLVIYLSFLRPVTNFLKCKRRP